MRFSAYVSARGRRGLPAKWKEHCYEKRVDRNPCTWERRMEHRRFRHSVKSTLVGYRYDWEDIFLPTPCPPLRSANW
jgi:hypothetical protein